jgi:hypothetical protein
MNAPKLKRFAHCCNPDRASDDHDRVRHDREWWRVEARGHGSDWPGILRLHAEVVAVWRSRHDPDCARAAS